MIKPNSGHSAIQPVPRGWCPEGGAQRVVPRGWCPEGGAQRGVPRGGCPAGGAQGVVPRGGCPEGGAQRVASFADGRAWQLVQRPGRQLSSFAGKRLPPLNLKALARDGPHKTGSLAVCLANVCG